MSPRLLVVCLGGLAGAVVCCDMDEGADALEPAPEAEDAALAAEPEEVAAEAVH